MISNIINESLFIKEIKTDSTNVQINQNIKCLFENSLGYKFSFEFHLKEINSLQRFIFHMMNKLSLLNVDLISIILSDIYLLKKDYDTENDPLYESSDTKSLYTKNNYEVMCKLNVKNYDEEIQNFYSKNSINDGFFFMIKLKNMKFDDKLIQYELETICDLFMNVYQEIVFLETLTNTNPSYHSFFIKSKENYIRIKTQLGRIENKTSFIEYLEDENYKFIYEIICKSLKELDTRLMGE